MRKPWNKWKKWAKQGSLHSFLRSSEMNGAQSWSSSSSAISSETPSSVSSTKLNSNAISFSPINIRTRAHDCKQLCQLYLFVASLAKIKSTVIIVRIRVLDQCRANWEIPFCFSVNRIVKWMRNSSVVSCTARSIFKSIFKNTLQAICSLRIAFKYAIHKQQNHLKETATRSRGYKHKSLQGSLRVQQ